MHHQLDALMFSAIVFFGIICFLQLGSKAGRTSPAETKGISTIEGSAFAVLGLLIAFTFSGAAERFEQRRHLITQETNAIGTAWLRIDTIPAETQPELRTLFLEYMETRASMYLHHGDREKIQEKMTTATELQRKIWNASVTATSRPDARNQAAMLLLPALNEMIDITTTRYVAMMNHPPTIIFVMLAVLACTAAFLAGYSMGHSEKNNLLHKVLFGLIIAIIFLITLELEYPRAGLIRVDAADQPLIDLYHSLAPRQ